MTAHDTWALAFIVLLPALGAFINGLFGKRLPTWLVSAIGCSSVGLSLALAVWQSFYVLASGGEARMHQSVYQWISAGGLSVSVGFTLDSLSTVMVLVVTGVSFLIHVYSIGYMEGDPSYSRYFAYLNLFVFSMLILVLADSLPLLFVGWEGVGLCSYLLIGFWFEDPAKASAGKKAFIVNRVGDFGFILGMFILFGFAGTLSVEGLARAAASDMIPGAWITAACLLLFVGATGKSAQIPLYVWLPDAMAGPTPVSALIHAATMVTAGVYMVARLSFLFSMSPSASAVVALVGGATAFFAATIGIAQTDIKKVLAYSTVSQLGYMFIGVGVGAYSAGIFHLMTHAFFKACLFLGSGAVIHALSGEQDIMRMGGLRKKLPWTYWTFLISTLAIAGCPFFSGFFSKDEILWKALSTATSAGSWIHGLVYGLGLAGAAITAFYMFRLVFLTFHGESRLAPGIHVHHENPVMSWPLAVLAFLAVVGGLPGATLFHVRWFEHFLEPVLATAPVIHKSFAHSASAEWWAAAGSVTAGLFGFGLAYNLYLQRLEGPGHLAARFSRAYRLLKNKYYVDEIYEVFPIKFVYYLAQGLWRIVDALIIDGLCVNGPAYAARGLGFIGRELQSGNLQVYAFWIFMGFSGLVLYFARSLGLI